MPIMSQPPEEAEGKGEEEKSEEERSEEAARTEADAQREEQTELQASPAMGDLGDLPE